MSDVLYFVGKPYLSSSEIAKIRSLGFKIGLLQDKSVNVKNLDRFDRVFPMDFSSQQTVLASIDGIELDAAGLISTFENYIVAKAQLAEKLGLPSPNLESAMKSTDKFLMRQAFLEFDPSITPKFALVGNESELLAAAANMSYPVIIKPTNLVKSLLVMKCNDETELKQNFAYALDSIAGLYEKYQIHGRKPQLIVEEFITGKTCSIAAFVDHNGTAYFCDGIVELTNAQDLGRIDNFIFERLLPGEIAPELDQKLRETTQKGIAALGMKSIPAHVELIYNDKEVKLIEIGARIGGYRPRMYEMSYGLDLTAQEINLATGKLPELQGNFKAFTAVWELFSEKEGEFVGLENAPNQEQFTSFKMKVRPGEKTGPSKNGYKAAAVIIATSADKSQLTHLQTKVKQIKVQVNT